MASLPCYRAVLYAVCGERQLHDPRDCPRTFRLSATNVSAFTALRELFTCRNVGT